MTFPLPVCIGRVLDMAGQSKMAGTVRRRPVPAGSACVNHPGRWAQTWRPTRLCRECERVVQRQIAKEFAAAVIAREARLATLLRDARAPRVNPIRVIDGVEYEVTWDGT